MIRYVTFDEEGRLDGSHLVYSEAEPILRALDDQERAYHQIPYGPGGLPRRDATYYSHQDKKLRQRPRMVLSVDRVSIRAGSGEYATIAGFPRGSKVTIFRNGLIMPGHDDVVVDDTSLEVESALPGTYRIEIEKWPYRRYAVEIEGTE